MDFLITSTLTAPADTQADELRRFLTHSGQLTVEVVTVAGSYKPTRARLLLVSIPDRWRTQAREVFEILTGQRDPLTLSKPVRWRAEWRLGAVLWPSTRDAAPLDGTVLDGWDSARLTIVYRAGQAAA